MLDAPLWLVLSFVIVRGEAQVAAGRLRRWPMVGFVPALFCGWAGLPCRLTAVAKRSTIGQDIAGEDMLICGKSPMSKLMGRQILIVEDETLIAEFLGMLVDDEGGTVVGVAVSVVQALRYIDVKRIDAAILDVNLRDGEVTPLVGPLRERGIPFVLHTGGILPSRLRSAIGDAPIFVKPVHSDELIKALQALKTSYREAPRTAHAGGHALVIEDDDCMARIVEAYLLRAGFGSVDRVSTQAGAITSSERRKPELMVVDIRLQEGDGLSAATAIQARLGAIPALFMTAHPELLGDGASLRCLKKPFTSLGIETAIKATYAGF